MSQSPDPTPSTTYQASLNLAYQAGLKPTAGEMRAFAARFDDAQWQRLCADKDFLHLVCHNLNRCAPLAEAILAGKKNALKATRKITAAHLRDNPDAWKKS